MMRLLWLAEDCRKAGLTVKELPGWKTRGAEFPTTPNTVLAHHTATPSAAKGDLPTQKILVDGRADLSGPLCQVALGRNGTVYVIASGKAQHAGPGAFRGVNQSASTIGVEAEHPGPGAWPTAQYNAYITLVAVLLRGLGQTSERTCSHAEWALPAGRKNDVRFDMNAFRKAVAGRMAPHTSPAPPTEEDDMTPEQETALVEKIAGAVEVRLKKHLAVVLHGTQDGNHPANLDNIWSAVKK